MEAVDRDIDEDESAVSKQITCVKVIDNSVKLNKLSSGLFCINDDTHLIHIVHFIGNSSWFGIGHVIKNTDNNHNGTTQDIKCFVFKEEMLYLMECGCCELIIEYKLDNGNRIQTCIGLNNTFTLFFSSPNDISFNIYSIYKRLKSMNYVIKRSELLKNEYLISQETELSTYFEPISFWIWKRGDNAWWKTLKDGFQSDNIKSIDASLKKLYTKQPDALLLIIKDNVKQENMNVNFIHSIIHNIDNIPIIIGNASQNDVSLFRFEINNLLH